MKHLNSGTTGLNRPRFALSTHGFSSNKFLIAAVCLSAVFTWGCKKATPIRDATTAGAASYASPQLKSNSVVGVDEFYVAVCNINSDQIEVYDRNDATWNSSTAKFIWKPTTALNFTSTEVSAWGNPADVKQRRIAGFDGQTTYYAVAGGHLAAIFNRADSKKVWAHTFSGSEYPRAMEILPNGNVAVAAYTAGWVRVYASSQGASNNTYYEVALPHALGLLYDHYNDILWAIGTNALKAYRVYGSSDPHFAEVTGMSKTLPSGSSGKDINCYFGDLNKLCISTTTGTYIYDKIAGTFTATAGASFHIDAVGFSNEPDGTLITCDNTTNVINFYNSSGVLAYTRTISGGAFYRAKTSGEYYQTRSNYAIATFNIKGQQTTTIPAGLTNHSWQERRLRVAVNVVKRYGFDVVGFIEPFAWQVADLNSYLGGYDHYGFSDGGDAGSSDTQNHHHEIFYRSNLFTVEASGKFWFAAGAPTSPPTGLKDGWTNSDPSPGKAKVCVWLKLKDKITGSSFYVFCAHYYYANSTTRQNSASLTLTEIPAILSAHGSAPVIFMGDLNSGTSSTAYNTLENSSLLQNSYDWASTITPTSYRATFDYNGTDANGDEIWETEPQDLPANKQQNQIDHIFLTNEWQSKVVSHNIIWDHYIVNENRAFSDHVPVYVELQKP